MGFASIVRISSFHAFCKSTCSTYVWVMSSAESSSVLLIVFSFGDGTIDVRIILVTIEIPSANGWSCCSFENDNERSHQYALITFETKITCKITFIFSSSLQQGVQYQTTSSIIIFRQCPKLIDLIGGHLYDISPLSIQWKLRFSMSSSSASSLLLRISLWMPLSRKIFVHVFVYYYQAEEVERMAKMLHNKLVTGCVFFIRSRYDPVVLWFPLVLELFNHKRGCVVVLLVLITVQWYEEQSATWELCKE